MEIQPPKAKKINKALTIHDDTRIDEYYWLNERDDEDVRSYLNAENAYCDQMLAHTKDFQDMLFNEIIARIKQTDTSVPYKFNDYFYLTRYEDGKEHPIYCRKFEKIDAKEEIMLDVNLLAEDYTYYRVGGRDVSPDNQVLAFGEDTLSRRIYTIRFKDLKTGVLLPDRIEGTTGSATWANDSKTVFYTRKDDTLRAYKIFKHVLGADPDLDQEIYHEQDETFNTFVFKTKSQKYLVIGSFATLSSEYRILNADQPSNDFKIFLAREHKHEHFISHFKNKFYIRTNWKAENFRLMETAEDQTQKSSWREVLPHRRDVLLDDVEVFEDYLVLSERINGITNLRIREVQGADYHIEFPEESFTAAVDINLDFNTDLLRFNYTSLTTPTSTFDFDMKTKSRTLLKQQEVVGDFDPDNYRSERLFAPARDGTKVPISIVYRKDRKKDESAPLLLYGYGSYGISIDPGFRSSRLSLLDRGFSFAIAHIRGGQEMGRNWYENGKFLKKENTFNDFIDCAKFLHAKKYCTPETTYALGGSAGGLLMGAVVNLAPDLFNGIIAAVPFVDVVTTMLDESIPLTTGEYDEWGNPNDPTFYHYMKSYSPYDNVRSQAYPAMLVTTGLHDSQVQYWEPAKWVARLRVLKTDDNPLFLHCNMETGHGGEAGRFKRYKETAMEYTFLLNLAGLIPSDK